MRWEDGRRSENVEDKRGSPMSRKVMVGGGGGIGILLIALLGLFFGFNPGSIFQSGSSVQAPPSPMDQPQRSSSAINDKQKEFLSVVLADTEDVWEEIFRQSKRKYEPPKLVLFSQAIESACGFAQAAMGPFYCPLDNKVYLDMSFFNDLQVRLGAEGDFAQAYVIAHEVAHHVQNKLGILRKVEEKKRRANRTQANNLSIRLELQADCLAGLWAHRAHIKRQILETGDIEEGLKAAGAVGDDRIQKQTQGYIVPDSFTHGTSLQRIRWFRRGLESGDLGQSNTFNTDRL